MKKIFTLVAMVAFLAACGGNPNKKVKVAEEAVAAVECCEGECVCTAEGEACCEVECTCVAETKACEGKAKGCCPVSAEVPAGEPVVEPAAE